MYLRMTLKSEGMNDGRTRERAIQGGRETNNLVGQRWWSVWIPTAQITTMFNTFVRSRHRYGLVLTGVGEEVTKQDKGWKEMAMNAFVKTKMSIGDKWKQTLRAILQPERLQWLVERKASQVVRRWKQKAEEQQRDKQAKVCRLSIQQIANLHEDTPL